MSTEISLHDYAGSGLTIRTAFLDHVQRFPDKQSRPDFILWSGHRVKTGDALVVPAKGVVRGEFLSWKGDSGHGFDLAVKGWIELAQGKRVTTLRTWNDPGYEPLVEYPFFSEDGRLWVWNVCRIRYPGGQVVEEKWTENSGMWVEEISPTERIYHCSHGSDEPPDFESLVFKITIDP